MNPSIPKRGGDEDSHGAGSRLHTSAAGPQEASKPLGHGDLLGPHLPGCFSLGLKAHVLASAAAPAGPAGKREKLPLSR